MDRSQLKKVTPWVWEAPQSARGDMRAPARVYATQRMLDAVFGDKTLDQLINVATLPGIQGRAIVMPDAHEGYGFPIGGVAATEYPDGVISPGGIGYDINCGVRLLRSTVTATEIKDHIKELAHQMNRDIPSGVGRGGQLKLGARELDHALTGGAQWMVKQGYGTPEDLRHIESNGCLDAADPSKVSDHAKKRGHDQIGTMGAGNHFVEIDRVDEIYDETIAAAFGLRRDLVVVLIHTGSRGLGHQVATDYIKRMVKKLPDYGIHLPDRELACAPLSSPEGRDYFAAMCAAANFAWANRQMITHNIRGAWRRILGQDKANLSVLYDVAHNIAKIEEHE
ncbi:MAG TPA: RtcB family protein, partial [candidate division Zixibacteria bacterium]|nr:RtcB family protein [candidate division Zixibacteria bacterium]